MVVGRAVPPAPNGTDGCPGWTETPVVLDAIDHPVMRRWSAELLAAAPGCWQVEERSGSEMVTDAINRFQPDVVVIDTAEFPACCRAALEALDPRQIIVVAPEPDPAYRSAALAQGASGSVSREHLGEELAPAVRRALGCPLEVCPRAAGRNPFRRRRRRP